MTKKAVCGQVSQLDVHNAQILKILGNNKFNIHMRLQIFERHIIEGTLDTVQQLTYSSRKSYTSRYKLLTDMFTQN